MQHTRHTLNQTSIMIILMLLIFGGPAHAGKDWYSGGTLHRASIAQWNHASAANRLATSADWVIVIPHVKNKVQRSGSIKNLRPYATQLMTCINMAVRGNNSNG